MTRLEEELESIQNMYSGDNRDVNAYSNVFNFNIEEGVLLGFEWTLYSRPSQESEYCKDLCGVCGEVL